MNNAISYNSIIYMHHKELKVIKRETAKFGGTAIPFRKIHVVELDKEN